MPQLHDLFDAYCSDIEGHLNTAYPGLVKIYRGWPNLELGYDDIPCAAIINERFAMEPSAARSSMVTVAAMIIVLLPLPTDKTKNIQMEGLTNADSLVALLESQFEWAEGGVNSYVTGVEVEPIPVEGREVYRIVIDFKVEYDRLLGS